LFDPGHIVIKHRWLKSFAFIPKKLDSGSWVFLNTYWKYQTSYFNGFNNLRHSWVTAKEVSNYERILSKLKD